MVAELPEFYAGIGSRKTPSHILTFMTELANAIERSPEPMILRSGGAAGADQAFERGTRRKQIFKAEDDIPAWAFNTVTDFHPAPERLSPYVERLHARNAMIVLGQFGDAPAESVICWTPDAQIVGGTGQSLRIAQAHNIPIINLARQSDLERMRLLIDYVNNIVED